MTEMLVISNIVLWVLVIILALVVLALARHVGPAAPLGEVAVHVLAEGGAVPALARVRPEEDRIRGEVPHVARLVSIGGRRVPVIEHAGDGLSFSVRVEAGARRGRCRGASHEDECREAGEERRA